MVEDESGLREGFDEVECLARVPPGDLKLKM
jgi:hypothetical protein